MAVNVRELTENKKQYMELLLLADEQESMIDQYIGRGRVFILEEPLEEDLKCGGAHSCVKAQCVITPEGVGIYELKNLAVAPDAQRRGYGRRMIEEMFKIFDDCKVMYVGTGDSPATVPFYEKCGFKISHRIKDFFTEHYDHPIYEEGVQLVDMVYLKKEQSVPEAEQEGSSSFSKAPKE